MIKLNAPWGILNPIEIDEIGFKSTFDKNYNVMQLSTESVTLANEDRENILLWIYNGQGRTENIPLTLLSDTQNQNYYLDLKTCSFTDSTVYVSIKPRKGADWFWEQADNLTFEAIEKISGLLSPYTLNVPYLVVKPDIALQTLIISVTTFSLVTEVIRTIRAIADLVGQALDVLGTGGLTTVVQALALVAYLAGMIIALISLISQLAKIFFPKLRNLKAMRDYDLIRLGCHYLGFTLDSTILTSLKNHLITLPIPVTREQNRESFFEKIADELTNSVFNYGFPTAGDTTPTLGSFIRQFMVIYNAETIAYNGVLKLENRAWYQQNPTMDLDLYFNEQELRESKFTFDIEQDFKRKTLSWQTDYTDLHTANNFFGFATEKNTDQISVINPDLVSVLGYKDEQFLFSYASRKEGLNFIEKTAKGLFKIADSLAGLFGGNSNFASNVTNREGVMIISEETFAITKKMWVNIQNGIAKQPADFKFYLNPFRIYDLYHKDLEMSVNSGIIYENMPSPLTEYQFMQFSQNKFVNLGGQTVELLTASFMNEQAQGQLTYKVFDGSGFNTKIKTIY